MVYLDVKKEGYEVVNEKDMEVFLPSEGEKQEVYVEIILCKKGYLEAARKKYYEITNDYIQKIYYNKALTLLFHLHFLLKSILFI